jgi:hypothetical protein
VHLAIPKEMILEVRTCGFWWIIVHNPSTLAITLRSSLRT